MTKQLTLSQAATEIIEHVRDYVENCDPADLATYYEEIKGACATPIQQDDGEFIIEVKEPKPIIMKDGTGYSVPLPNYIRNQMYPDIKGEG